MVAISRGCRCHGSGMLHIFLETLWEYPGKYCNNVFSRGSACALFLCDNGLCAEKPLVNEVLVFVLINFWGGGFSFVLVRLMFSGSENSGGQGGL